MNIFSKKGSTLLELCIVMALVSILIAVTVGFTTAVNGVTASSRQKYYVIEDYLLCKKYVENWVKLFNEDGVTFDVTEEYSDEETETYTPSKLTATKNGKVYELTSEKNADGTVSLVLNYEQSENKVTYASNVFTSVKFTKDASSKLVRCEMIYEGGSMAFVMGGVVK